ncbi:MAG: TRAP transporter substrate-binding protein [Gammaproteobacteria bacterium]|nr:TRAP transporter substrate-binding protein [Gammaproteobacteria bacterium]
MKRRDLIVGAGALGVSACAQSDNSAQACADGKTYNWKMVTAWPANFPGLGTHAQNLADHIETASNGRIKIRLFAGGELVPPFEVFGAVSQGMAEIGHGSAYYWKGKTEAAQFFTALPFGLSAPEQNGWLYYGGGLELYRELYAPFNLMPFPAGNSGAQMGGWFNKEINSLEDLKGLKMRLPGLGGEVLAKAGGTPVATPGSEIFTALQTGALDATEWVGPYNDMAMGLHQAARYYYYPGWHEPGPTLEAIVNKEAFDALPEDLQKIIELSCSAVNDQMFAEYMARNGQSLEQILELEEQGEIEIRKFPDEVLRELRRLSDEVVLDLVKRDPKAEKIYESYETYRKRTAKWTAISEQAMLNTRDL